MDINNKKNIVVLKDLPSNMIEEAFIVLKSNVKIHKAEIIDKEKGKKIGKERISKEDHIIKEAEMIVSDYIKRFDKKDINKISTEKIIKKYKKLKLLTIFTMAFTILYVISNLIK